MLKSLSPVALCSYFTATIQALSIFTLTISSGFRCAGHFFTPFRSDRYLVRIAESFGSDCSRRDTFAYSRSGTGLAIEVLTGARYFPAKVWLTTAGSGADNPTCAATA